MYNSHEFSVSGENGNRRPTSLTLIQGGTRSNCKNFLIKDWKTYGEEGKKVYRFLNFLFIDLF